jgi:ABC-2 type transporter
VYFGGVGRRNCSQLVNYFETRGVQSIELGENPANWILRELESMNEPALQYKRSQEYAALLCELQDVPKFPGERIEYGRKFPAAPWKRRLEVNSRLRKIYWRSPTYNYTRLLVSLVIAVVLGSAFFTKRGTTTFSETEMRARVSVVFLSFIVTGLMAIVSVLPVMTKIRDMFYRHRDALMYDSASMGLALGVAEQGFLLFSTMIFSTVFLAVTGVGQPDEPVRDRVGRAVGFWVRASRPNLV